MSNIKSYKLSWKRLNSDSFGGGQGTTFKACEIESKDTIAAIKVLNRQNDDERRARMYRESSVLSTISHSNIPRFIDTNTEYWTDKEYKLFIATEFIEGATLSEINLSEISFLEKIRLTKEIAETIKFCHEKGIVHRDIKPDNIIISNIDKKPYVIDFGISFNFNDDDDDHLTPDGQQLGNRFLILPEQKIGEIGKRDYRTDTCCLVGLFYYILTTDLPIIIIDEHNRKPHQRDIGKASLKELPKHYLDMVNYIFDIGFSQLIDKRWQTINGLIEQLSIIETAEEKDMDNKNNQLERIKLIQNTPDFQEKVETRNLLNDLNTQVRTTLDELSTELQGGWSTTQSGGILPNGVEYKNKYHPYNTINQELNPHTTIHGFVTGNELVVRCLEGVQKESNEIFRHSISDNVNWFGLREALKAYWINIISNKI